MRTKLPACRLIRGGISIGGLGTLRPVAATPFSTSAHTHSCLAQPCVFQVHIATAKGESFTLYFIDLAVVAGESGDDATRKAPPSFVINTTPPSFVSPIFARVSSACVSASPPCSAGPLRPGATRCCRSSFNPCSSHARTSCR